MPTKFPIEEGYVRIAAGGVTLYGNLLIPDQAQGLVIFAHGSGSSRHSSRNQLVAQRLRGSKLGTLLFDLLTEAEEAEDLISGNKRFDIGLLSRRLVAVTDWLRANNATRHMALGYFGASTGAAAALVAAAERADQVSAVVSRGGRPDLAEPFLQKVRSPVLLIVGGEDHVVIEMNRKALARINSEKKMIIVPGATHLFEEPGALDQVARLAADWFANNLRPGQKEIGAG
jgi:putative phosphoribosyl transferase